MEKEIMGKVKGPTREQIKEAFQDTIARWERIVEDPHYFSRSSCDLCPLFFNCSETKACPIAIYTKETNCKGTPYLNFYDNHTPENALAELNFLRKVYIWWMEGETKDAKGNVFYGNTMEEKKEEWVDITREVDWRLKIHAEGRTYWVRGYYGGKHIVWLDTDGIHRQGGNLDIKIEKEDMSFRILKKI